MASAVLEVQVLVEEKMKPACYITGAWRVLLLASLVSTAPLFGQNESSSAPVLTADAYPLKKQVEEIVRSVSSVRTIPQAVLSPDGQSIAYVIADAESGGEALFLASRDGKAPPRRVPMPSLQTSCQQAEPAWSPDGTVLAFLSDCAGASQAQLFLFEVMHPGAISRSLTRLDGHLATPKWAPDGRTIAFLFVDHATRAPNPMAAGDAQTGVIDDLQQQQAQRLALATIATGETRMLSPSSLNLFEFDWSPDSRKVAYTAAPPPGDDNWYIAQLYTQKLTEAAGHSIYKPELQIALPRWSPDGKQIAFITGLMSDESATAGEIHLVPSIGGSPRNLTDGRSSSPAWITWLSPESLLFTEYQGGSTAISTLNTKDGKTETLWTAGETVHALGETTSLSIAVTASPSSMTVALVRESWTQPPEVWAGAIGKWAQVTHLNQDTEAAARQVESVTWRSDSFEVQGWLLFPKPYDPHTKYPMLVSVHGGPAWIQTPTIVDIDFNANAFVNLGYFIFLPNPRGSFGQGEHFTQANRRDWGFGDLRDTVAGVDTVLAKYPVDPSRVGMLGWSYGASTAMIAAGRTDRFRAFVAGAGACNLQSYYGQNQIDTWMMPYFGASVYDDTAAYMRSSALTYVKQVKAPVLLLVGERDEEAPPPQSFEFWHALKELHVPTQLVVYAGEGHSFHKYEDRVDLVERTADWFAKYMPPSAASVKATRP